jgi:anti-anti-sigma factor
MALAHTQQLPPFAAYLAPDGECVCVHLVGELDLMSAPEAAAVIAQAEGEGPRTLEIDLSALTFMDSTGLRLLLGARERASAEGRQLVLRRGPDAIQRLFEITALTSRFEFVA